MGARMIDFCGKYEQLLNVWIGIKGAESKRVDTPDVPA
jgi:hypothetical protein